MLKDYDWIANEAAAAAAHSDGKERKWQSGKTGKLTFSLLHIFTIQTMSYDFSLVDISVIDSFLLLVLLLFFFLSIVHIAWLRAYNSIRNTFY